MPRTKPSIAPEAALQLDKQLCFALYSASLAMTKVYKPLLERLQLTYPQYLVLLVLWEQDGQSVTALGDKLFLDSGTLTPLLKRMETAGLLLRQRATQDERRVEVWLTAQGRALREQALAIPACIVDAVACPLTEIASLTAQVQTLRQQLQDAANQATHFSPAANAAH